MFSFNQFYVFSALALTFASCAPGRRSISERPLGFVPKTSESSENSRPVAAPSVPTDLYTRRNDVQIKPIAHGNETGSLGGIDDPRNYLLGGDAPVVIGSFLDIKVTSNRADALKSPGDANADAAKSGDGANAAGKDNKSPDQMEQELIKELPNLEPGSKDHPVLLKTFKMQVMHQYENGDVLVMYKRRSVRGDQAGEIIVKGRVPYAALQRRDQLTTTDLADIDWRESNEGELGERRSANWEDEYTLRMSGFDEARSKPALAIEEQRRQLKEIRSKLGNQIKSFAQERQTVAKERSDLAEQKKQYDEKLSELEKKVADQEKEIESLKPAEETPPAENGTQPAGGAAGNTAANAGGKTAGNSKGAPKALAKAAPKKAGG